MKRLEYEKTGYQHLQSNIMQPVINRKPYSTKEYQRIEFQILHTLCRIENKLFNRNMFVSNGSDESIEKTS